MIELFSDSSTRVYRRNVFSYLLTLFEVLSTTKYGCDTYQFY